jgi:hypothetical protein
VTTANPRISSLKAHAEAISVEILVDRVSDGLVRVPKFQRGLRWGGKDVVALFDSVYRGYPVGSFLLNRAKAGAEKLTMGPLTIDAPETETALWVVDGQQRITALTAVLSRPAPIPATPEDAWVVYFDARERTFRMPTRGGSIPQSWVPAVQLLDASVLSEWVHSWSLAGDVALRSAVFEAGSRIRQYQIPLYIVETGDEQALRDIFYRINNFGKRLKWSEIHDALFGHDGGQPSTLEELTVELRHVGAGDLDEEQLLSCILAFKGLDVTRSIVEHYGKDPELLKGTVQEGLPSVRRALSFLKIHAEIPHLRLLPRSTPLPVLTRFFALYQEPSARTLTLLTRWTWRTLLGKSLYDERTLLRRGVSLIADDEEQAAQNLLSLLPEAAGLTFRLPERFDARAADSRIALVALSSLRPMSVLDGTPLDVAALIEARGVNAFRKITAGHGALARGPANRILLPGTGFARKEIIDRAALDGDDSPILRSHAISTEGVAALRKGEAEKFFENRREIIERAVGRLGDRLAAWSRSDRPSVSYLLKQAEGDA